MIPVTDYILNGQGFGPVAQAFGEAGFNPGAMRPYYGPNGTQWITVNKQDPKTGLWVPTPQRVLNATGTLFPDTWKQMDDVVQREARAPMRAWADLRGANTKNIPEAMGTMVFQYRQMRAFGSAQVSMDPDRVGERDRPVGDLQGIPLPVIHADFWYGMRESAAAGRSGMSLEGSGAEEAGLAIGETIEKMTIGTAPSFSYSGVTIYGMTSFPDRITTTVTAPTTAGWTPRLLVQELLAMQALSVAQNFTGPWVLYFSQGWTQYLDDDYSDAKGDSTLRTRLSQIDGFPSIRTLPGLSGFQIIMIQMTATVARALVGMDITTLSWPSNGGMRQNYKAMAILVPQYRNDAAGQCGLIHATGV